MVSRICLASRPGSGQLDRCVKILTEHVYGNGRSRSHRGRDHAPAVGHAGDDGRPDDRRGQRRVDAGAGIVHHHHDMRLDEEQAIRQIVDTAIGIQSVHPSTLVYTDYLTGKRATEENAHLSPLAQAGLLTMFAIDPGLTTFASYDKDGVPSRTYVDGLHFGEAHEMVEFSKEHGVPISLGVFEPGHLRWILAYERARRVLAGHDRQAVLRRQVRRRPGRHEGDQLRAPADHGRTRSLPVDARRYRLPWIVSLFGDSVLDSPPSRGMRSSEVAISVLASRTLPAAPSGPTSRWSRTRSRWRARSDEQRDRA